jgi:hypothetical protein
VVKGGVRPGAGKSRREKRIAGVRLSSRDPPEMRSGHVLIFASGEARHLAVPITRFCLSAPWVRVTSHGQWLLSLSGAGRVSGGDEFSNPCSQQHSFGSV